jgi:hypothetical protein
MVVKIIIVVTPFIPHCYNMYLIEIVQFGITNSDGLGVCMIALFSNL